MIGFIKFMTSKRMPRSFYGVDLQCASMFGPSQIEPTEPTHYSQRVGHGSPGVVVWSLSVVLSWLRWEMLGDISYDKATLQSEGK